MAPLLDQFSFRQKTTGVDHAQQHSLDHPVACVQEDVCTWNTRTSTSGV
jgi:hypothetical protein